MAKYKCIVSGNVIEFTNQVDIDSMVGHEGYLKLEEQQQEAPKTPVAAKKTAKVAAQQEVEVE